MVDRMPVTNQTVTKTTTYQMKSTDLVVNASISGGSWTLTLPPVGEAEGTTFTINCTAGATNAAPNTLSINDKGDSLRWNGIIKLRRPGQSAVLTSDGTTWRRDYIRNGQQVLPADKYVHEMFETMPTQGTKAGGAPSATLENVLRCGSGMEFSWIAIVGQTLMPTWGDPGLDIACDQTGSDGFEMSTGIGAGNPRQFTISTDGAFFVRVRGTIADVSGYTEFAVGFRKRAAYAAAIDDYTDMAVLNVQAGAVFIETILNNAATTSTDTTNTWADAATHSLAVLVTKAGVVTYQYDDAAPTTVAAFTFDSTDEVIPFIHFLQGADLAGATPILEFECGYQ
jgi:hypothetical protein